jgi:hypothetical protein
MFQTKVAGKIKTHIFYFVFSNSPPPVYEIMWKNIVQPDRPQVAI